MVAGRTSQIVRGSGRVVLNPTDLEAAYPYGGVEVGLTREVALTPLGTGFRVMSEAFGEATDVLEASNEFVFACVVRGWDDDAVELLLSDGQAAGATTRRRTWSSPGIVTPGASALDRAVSLLYVPDDSLHVPACLIYRGIPSWADSAELFWQRRAELALPIALDCLRDARDRILSVGMLADLEL